MSTPARLTEVCISASSVTVLGPSLITVHQADARILAAQQIQVHAVNELTLAEEIRQRTRDDAMNVAQTAKMAVATAELYAEQVQYEAAQQHVQMAATYQSQMVIGQHQLDAASSSQARTVATVENQAERLIQQEVATVENQAEMLIHQAQHEATSASSQHNQLRTEAQEFELQVNRGRLRLQQAVDDQRNQHQHQLAANQRLQHQVQQQNVAAANAAAEARQYQSDNAQQAAELHNLSAQVRALQVLMLSHDGGGHDNNEFEGDEGDNVQMDDDPGWPQVN